MTISLNIAGPAAIEFVKVDKRFEAKGKAAAVQAVQNVNFAIATGEVRIAASPLALIKRNLQK
jgi:hypothetical protein